MEKHRNFSIRMKMYIFVIIIVLAVAIGTSAMTFLASANQLDSYYKQNTADNARNFASMVDGDYLKKLRIAAESEEFQKLREQAEEAEDEKMIETYLREHDLWEEYSRIRDMITSYLANMEGIKYLYVVAHGGPDADYDMYLVDDKENPLYETGYYEERGAELRGLDISMLKEPTISNGDWGWLCSDFKPVFTSDGECVCIVGCDIGMDDVMQARRRLLFLLIAGTLIIASVMLVAAVFFINKTVVKPLNSMTSEMKNFRPSGNLSYEEAGVMEIDIKSNDEIGEIYQGIRSMQMRIIDYIKDMLVLEAGKKKAENDLKDKEERIDQLSAETYKDALTGVGNKAAYIKKTEELNQEMKDLDLEFALVMIDINNLKTINDEFGHRSGDLYIKGCCHMVCDTYKHSPVYRIGGDEFVVVLFGADYTNRQPLLEQLKTDFEKTYEQTDVTPWERYSASVGMAEKASNDLSSEFVFRRADAAMYKDKARFKKKYNLQQSR